MSQPAHTWRRRLLAWITVFIVGLVISLLLDKWAYRTVADTTKTIEKSDLYQFCRAIGFLPLWVVVSGAMLGFALASAQRRAHLSHRALYVLLSPIFAGLAAELLKLIVGRERPILHNGRWFFKPFQHGFIDSAGLGMPSSHTAVAFGGTMAIAILYRGTGPAMFIVASACGFSRLLTGAHFLSDVFVGACLGYAIAYLLSLRVKTNTPS